MATTKTTTKKKAPAKKVEAPAPTITRGFKGFDKQLRCRDMQFEVGKVYTEPEARLCRKGLHFVEFPLDALTYYSPVGSRFCDVSTPCVSPETENDSKRVTTEIHIGVEIGLPGLVKAAFDYVWKRALERQEASTGWGAHCASTGPRAHCATAGKNAIAAALGMNSAAKAVEGWLVLAGYNADDTLECVKAAKVGGPEGIKADTYYRLTAAGEFVEATDIKVEE